MADIPLQFSNLGNALAAGAHAGYYAQEGRQKAADEERRQQAQPYIEPAINGDPGAFAKVASGDPKTALLVSQALQRMDANKQQHVKGAAEYTAQGANAILQADPAERPALYKQIIEQGRQRGYDLSGLPPEYSPALDGQLRTHRAMAIPIVKWFEEQGKQKDRDVRLQVHNSPGGGGPPTMGDMPGGGAAPLPASAPPAPGRPSASAAPPVPATAVAQAPRPPIAEGTGLPIEQGDGGPPSSPAGDGTAPPRQPKRDGEFFYENPAQYGYRMQARLKNGVYQGPATDDQGRYVYKHPQTGELVLFKPMPDKPHGPEGPFSGNAIEAQYANILIKGDPSTPEYAQAYAHFASPRTQVNENGQTVTIQPNVSHLRQPTYRPPMGDIAPGGPATGPATAGAQTPVPGGQTVTVQPGRGHPIPAGESEKIASGVTLITNIDKALEAYTKPTGDLQPSGRGAGFVSRNFGQGGDLIAQSIDPGGVKARALISDITSQIMLARSGAAVTEGEARRLIGMLPSAADGPEVVKQKLGQVRSTYAEMLRNQTSQYTKENGFIPHEGAGRVLGGSGDKSGLYKKYGLE